MKSPFPGMDPWLEDPARWSSFHTTFIASIQRTLQPLLTPRYVARAELRVYLAEEGDLRAAGYRVADVGVQVGDQLDARAVAATAVAEAPQTVPVRMDVELRERFIEIVDPQTGGLVTAIEVLSPTNKATGRGATKYETKRSEYLGGDVSLVEIDLLREGRRPGVLPPVRDDVAYAITVARPWTYPDAMLTPIRVNDRLPDIAVPLRESDGDVTLSLQACFDDAYEAGGFGYVLDYSRPPNPPLPPQFIEWATGRIAAWRAANEETPRPE